MSLARLSDEEVKKLRELTLDARSLSYSPYSKFRVGACLLDASGEYFQGANVREHAMSRPELIEEVENAAYSGLCAERTALVKAVTSHKGHDRRFRAVGVAADTVEPCTPCGNCRQFLREFSLDMEVYMFTEKGHVMKTLEELLPMSFGPESLAPADDKS